MQGELEAEMANLGGLPGKGELEQRNEGARSNKLYLGGKTIYGRMRILTSVTPGNCSALSCA